MLLSKAARSSFQQLKDAKATDADWYMLTQRLTLCGELVHKYYTEQGAQGMDQAVSAVIAIMQRKQATGASDFDPTLDELGWIEAGLEAADEVEKGTTVAQQREVYAAVMLRINPKPSSALKPR